MFDLVRHTTELTGAVVHTPLDNAVGWSKGSAGVTNAMGASHYRTEAVERYNNCTGAGYQTEHWHLDSATGKFSSSSCDNLSRIKQSKLFTPLSDEEKICRIVPLRMKWAGGPPFTKMDAADVKKMEAIRMCWEPLTMNEPIVNFPSTLTFENLVKYS